LRGAGPHAKTGAGVGLIVSGNSDIREEIEMFLGIEPDTFYPFRINADIVHIEEADIRELLGEDLLDFAICLPTLIHVHFPTCKFDKLIHGRI
jgi:hypothetical protein